MTKQELYIKAKEAYYAGYPIMSDAEFDELEQEVGVGAVGAIDKDAKFNHPTKMLSLSKIQADKTTGAAPTAEATDWVMSIAERTSLTEPFEVTCKYDGNSGNCIYINGKLSQVLTRGDGFTGRDITEKVRHLIPETISFTEGVCEVRGEIIMKKSVFSKKYEGKFANPRNLVAGILGRDDDEMIEDLSFIAYDMKVDGVYFTIDDINKEGFNKEDKPFCIKWKPNESFAALFQTMVEEREKTDFPLDGFVLKTAVKYRNSLGESDHDPKWGKAIKFKPVGVTTEVENISWSMGKTGEFTPIAILKPIELDGTVVKRACLYNAGYVKNYGIKKGTRVRIVKAGDIIPQIVEVFN